MPFQKPPRPYLSATDIILFYESAIANRELEAKKPIGRLENTEVISTVIGYTVAVDELVLQASYLHHIHDYHGPDGVRHDRYPVLPEDIVKALDVVNGDLLPAYRGDKTHTGNPLIKYQLELGGIVYKVIAEVRAGKSNRNLALYNLYKR